MRISFAIESDVIAGRLISEASRLKCDPRQLGVALVTVVLDAMLVDNVLDGDDPKRFARHYGQVRARTPLEDRIDEVFMFVASAIHDRHDGQVALGVRDIARGIGTKSGVVARAMKHLVTSGRVIATRSGHREKTIYSLPKREVQ
jgi:hypothetical protein